MPTAYITAPRDAAAELARLLVEERLAACVNVVDCESTYRWEGAVHDDPESVLLAKTTADAYGRLVERVTEAHPSDVPCVERFDEADVLASFGAWRDGAVE
jgi:periplasmic divalent cation tolerance protein